VIVTVVDVDTADVAIGKVAVKSFAGTVVVAGTLATAGLLLVSVTTAPPSATSAPYSPRVFSTPSQSCRLSALVTAYAGRNDRHLVRESTVPRRWDIVRAMLTLASLRVMV
jgi:hypothetical protein